MQNVKVADLVHDDGYWNWALLNHWLPVHVLRKSELVLLMAIVIFRIISMIYRLLCNFQMDDINTDWKQIWCLKVLERVRHFYG
jgi:hypothetical protein